MKKIIKVLILVLLPLVATFLMGLYGYNYYSGGTQIKYDYYKDVEAKTSSQVQAFMQYNEYKYEKDSVYKKTVESPNNNGEKLLTFEIFRSCYMGKKTIKKEEVEMELARYIFVVYDVNYDEILTLFDLTSSQIDDASTPTLKLVLTPNDLEEYTEDDKVVLTLTNASKSIDGVFGIVDYGAKPSKEDPDPFTTSSYTGAFYTRWNIETGYDADFGTDFTMNLEANTVYVEDTLEIKDADDKVKPLLVVDYDFTKTLSKWENTKFVEGYNNNEVKAGYFMWVTGKYLWWICLITFVVVGSLTYVFVAVWESEDSNVATKKATKKVQKK